MMTTKKDERAEISLLLPWYAAGTLNAAETRRVALAVAADPELAARLDDIRAEAAETLILNESIPAPSRNVADKLFAAIDAEEAVSPRTYSPRFSLSQWMGEKLTLARPRTLAFAAAAAVAIIALQAGLLVSSFGERELGGFQTATAPGTAVTGPQLLVHFAPTATVADIEALLKDSGGMIVEGPQGGLFRVQIGPSSLDQAGIDRVVEKLRDRPDLVRFVAPASN